MKSYPAAGDPVQVSVRSAITAYAFPSHAKSYETTPSEACIMLPFASTVKVSPVNLLFAMFSFHVPSHDGPAAKQGTAASANTAHAQFSLQFIRTSVDTSFMGESPNPISGAQPVRIPLIADLQLSKNPRQSICTLTRNKVKQITHP